AANQIAADADLVLAVGTRLTDFTTASQSLFRHPAVRFVNLQIDPYDAHKQGALALVADARCGLEDLGAALGGYSTSSPYRGEIAAARSAWNLMRDEIVGASQGDSGALHQAAVLAILNEHAGPESTVVHAA